MLWVFRKTLEFMLLRSKLILLSPAPHPIQYWGEVTKYALGVQKNFGVDAASQQTYFIVSGSQPIQC